MERFNFGGDSWKPVTKKEIHTEDKTISEKNKDISLLLQEKIKIKLDNQDMWKRYELPKELYEILNEKSVFEEQKQDRQQELIEARKEGDDVQADSLGQELQDIDLYINTLDKNIEAVVGEDGEVKDAYQKYLDDRMNREKVFRPADPEQN